MNTLPDFKLSANTWVEVYTSLSIPSGTPLVIRTKNSRPVLIQYADSAPTEGSNDGFILYQDSDPFYTSPSTAVTGGTTIATFLLGSVSTVPFDLNDILDTINPGESLTITARVISGAASEVGVSLIWQEDF